MLLASPLAPLLLSWTTGGRGGGGDGGACGGAVLILDPPAPQAGGSASSTMSVRYRVGCSLPLLSCQKKEKVLTSAGPALRSARGMKTDCQVGRTLPPAR